MKKKKKKIKLKKSGILIMIGTIAFTTVLSIALYFIINLGSVSSDTTIKKITIEPGSISSIGNTLKDNKLIKNVKVFNLYTRITGNSNLKAGVYELSEDMGVAKIVKILSEGSKHNPNEVSITFKEGLNIRKIATLISENTNNSYDNILEKVNDRDYINSLIEKYWFLTDDIKAKDIYYSLEGYLFPDTYFFTNKDVTVEEIFSKMLDEMDNKLSSYKSDIENSKYSIHEIMTMASIVELEEGKKEDRESAAGVFYNRLNSSYFPTLGSDATTYYAVKIDDWSYKLSSKELNTCNNKYNTRCSTFTGLPIGPICNPSIESIKAAIYPEKHDYYYFVNACDGTLYLTKTSTEHENTISKLRREGNWCP